MFDPDCRALVILELAERDGGFYYDKWPIFMIPGTGLEERGLLRRLTRGKALSDPVQVYEITDAGRAELKRRIAPVEW
jgi:hypothetical protein